LSVAVVVGLIGGLRVLMNLSATSSPSPTSIVSGTVRNAFVSAGMKKCLSRQQNDPDNKALSLSTKTITTYCSCYMNAIADITTYGDIKKEAAGSVPTELSQKYSGANASCLNKMRRGLMGEGK